MTPRSALIRQLRAELDRARRGGLRLRQGVVDGTNVDGTVDVLVSGETDPTQLHSLAPVTTGDTVWVAVQDGVRLVVIGAQQGPA